MSEMVRIFNSASLICCLKLNSYFLAERLNVLLSLTKSSSFCPQIHLLLFSCLKIIYPAADIMYYFSHMFSSALNSAILNFNNLDRVKENINVYKNKAFLTAELLTTRDKQYFRSLQTNLHFST